MLANPDRYFDHLNAYRDGDANGMIRYLAHCTATAADEAVMTAGRLAILPDQWQQQVNARRGSTAFKLLHHLPEHPVLNVDTVHETTGASVRRSYDALDRLTEAGVLQEQTGFRRNRIWMAPDVFEELADLEHRIGQRAGPGAG